MGKEPEMKNRDYMSQICITFVTSVASLLLVFPVQGVNARQHDPLPEINWMEGPRTVNLGNNIAQIDLGEDYVFANAADTRRLMQLLGNPVSNMEVGFIRSRERYEDWFVVFEYDPVGYIPDDEKDSLDADAILDSIKRGNEEANKIREEKGWPLVNVIGWYEKPHYDSLSHNLVWAVLGESNSSYGVNYNVRLLGRHGYTSAVLVTEPGTLDSLKPELENIIANFSYKTGKRYAEFVQGDKVAKYGLVALIAGGAGAAAVKFGLLKWLAKAWKIVAVSVIAFFTALWRISKGLLGREERISFPQ